MAKNELKLSVDYENAIAALDIIIESERTIEIYHNKCAAASREKIDRLVKSKEKMVQEKKASM